VYLAMFRFLFGGSEKDRIKDPLAGFWSEGKADFLVTDEGF